MDTSVLVSAFRNRESASNRLLRHLPAGRVLAVATQALFYEYEAVLKRPEQLLATGLKLHEVDEIIAALYSVVKPVEVDFRWRPRLPDANDEMVLEAAINGHADAIVTFNTRDFRGATEEFGIRILAPRVVLEDVENG